MSPESIAEVPEDKISVHLVVLKFVMDKVDDLLLVQVQDVDVVIQV